jgi:hypothetical protein
VSACAFCKAERVAPCQIAKAALACDQLKDDDYREWLAAIQKEIEAGNARDLGDGAFQKIGKDAVDPDLVVEKIPLH